MAFQFNAIEGDNRIDWGDMALTHADFTVSLWWNPASGVVASPSDFHLVGKQDSNYLGWRLYFDAVLGSNPNRMRAYFLTSGGGGLSDRYDDQELTADEEGTWLHYAVTWDDTGHVLRLYKNGVEQTSTTSGGCTGPNEVSDGLIVGWGNLNPAWLGGGLAQIAVFERVLTPAEIAGLAGGADPRTLSGGAASFLAPGELESQAGRDVIGDIIPSEHTANFAHDGPALDYTTQDDDEFVVVILPDTQKYTFASPSYIQHFIDQCTWIKEHYLKENSGLNERIAAVAHLGDVVETYNIASQWTRARSAMDILLSNGVPFTILPGNHDCDVENVTTRAKPEFNDADSGYPPGYSSGQPWYGGHERAGDGSNSYLTFSAGGFKWLLISLELGPDTDTLAWAAALCQQYADHRVIISTHSYMYYTDTDSDLNEDRHDHLLSQPNSADCHGFGNGAGLNTLDCHDGQEMWDELIKVNRNIFLVVSGHVCTDGKALWTALNDYGLGVHQMLCNYQSEVTGSIEGGHGFMRLLRFRPSAHKIEVVTFSPNRQDNSHYWLASDDTFDLAQDYQRWGVSWNKQVIGQMMG
ncbi:MAG: metallophosphoesterase [Phycisphaerae bacterium]|nr:metallophosphoesterase [Phycisphaerae bacterium]